MDDAGFERLLSGYRLPAVSPQLDHRVLGEGAAIMERARTRAMLGDAGHSVLHGLGFGYLAWLVDFATATDAEYRVELI